MLDLSLVACAELPIPHLLLLRLSTPHVCTWPPPTGASLTQSMLDLSLVAYAEFPVTHLWQLPTTLVHLAAPHRCILDAESMLELSLEAYADGMPDPAHSTPSPAASGQASRQAEQPSRSQGYGPSTTTTTFSTTSADTDTDRAASSSTASAQDREFFPRPEGGGASQPESTPTESTQPEATQTEVSQTGATHRAPQPRRNPTFSWRLLREGEEGGVWAPRPRSKREQRAVEREAEVQGRVWTTFGIVEVCGV